MVLTPLDRIPLDQEALLSLDEGKLSETMKKLHETEGLRLERRTKK